MIDELFAAIDNRDARAFAKYLTDDCIFRFGNQQPVVGREKVKEYVENFFDSIEGIDHEVGEVWSVDGVMVCHGSVTYTRSDGSRLQVPFANILKMAGHRIREYLIFVDASALYAN